MNCQNAGIICGDEIECGLLAPAKATSAANKIYINILIILNRFILFELKGCWSSKIEKEN